MIHTKRAIVHIIIKILIMIQDRKRRDFKNEVNSGSMADIAFLLLIFFLVSTTINVDTGILVKLPPYKEDVKPPIISQRNMCRILINHSNELFVRDKEMSLDELSDYIKDFISNPNSSPNMAKNPTKAIVSLQNDRATHYKYYIDVYNEIKRAYNELRNEEAQIVYGKPFEACNKIQKSQIAAQIPMLLSESEPVDYSIVNK